MNLKKLEAMLNKTLKSVLWGGPSDPSWESLEAAAAMYVTLQHLNLSVEDESDTCQTIVGANIYGHDFLKQTLAALME